MNRKSLPIMMMITMLVFSTLACKTVTRAVGAEDAPTPTASKINTSEPASASVPTSAAEANNTIEQPATQVAISEPQTIRQWAVSATASSEYGESTWGAVQATGAPDVPSCGDNGLAWASFKPDGLDWIELTYATPVIPTEINIYQSYNPSQVVEVDLIDTSGITYTAWQGDPEQISTCPDLMTITFDEKQEMLVEKVVVIVDQSIMNMGWNEIDAVELVGIGEGGQPVVEKPAPTVAPSQPVNIPDSYSGWMAEQSYQGYIQVIVGQTRADELDALIGMTGKKSSENWKPRPDHADTYIFDFDQNDMRAFISVTTQGVVYSKSISPNTYPSDFKLTTVTKANYDQLDAIFKRDKAVPYRIMADLLGHPGFMSQQVLREDGRVETNYNWYAANGDRIIGIFFDGVITGIAGLAYIPK